MTDPSTTPATAPEFGSDVVVDLLCDLGIRFVACNPGATFRGVHDSLVNYRADAPVVIECTHEEISVAIAHGYVKASGTPMVAAVHDVVGLQHASMAIYNAWCDRAPVLVLGGTGPVDAAKRRPWIDWIHTASTQAEQVRDYTRWDDQPASVEALGESFVRAHQMATSAPQGPVYVCLDSEVQEQRLPEGFNRPDVRTYAAPGEVAPSAAVVDEVAGWLVEATAPVLCVETVDRSQEALEALVRLAELLGAPVLEPSRDYNRPSFAFPWAHPLAVTGVPGALPPADVVVGIEVRDLESVRGLERAPGARVALASTAHLGAKAWAADLQRLQQADRYLPASAAPTVHALLAAVERRLADDPAARGRAASRSATVAARTSAQRAEWREQAAAATGPGPVHPAYLSLALEAATRGADPVLANGNLYGWVQRLWDVTRVDSSLGSAGGAGLGYGIGASIGAALAHLDDDRLVVDIQSDGDFLMTPGALWTAAHHQVPLLVVMDNNRAYNNSVAHAGRIATARGRSTATAGVGTAIADPPIDFAQMARSMGVRAFGPVESTEGLDAVLAEAVDVVRRTRQPVLVDVITRVPQSG